MDLNWTWDPRCRSFQSSLWTNVLTRLSSLLFSWSHSSMQLFRIVVNMGKLDGMWHMTSIRAILRYLTNYWTCTWRKLLKTRMKQFLGTLWNTWSVRLCMEVELPTTGTEESSWLIWRSTWETSCSTKTEISSLPKPQTTTTSSQPIRLCKGSSIQSTTFLSSTLRSCLVCIPMPKSLTLPIRPKTLGKTFSWCNLHPVVQAQIWTEKKTSKIQRMMCLENCLRLSGILQSSGQSPIKYPPPELCCSKNFKGLTNSLKESKTLWSILKEPWKGKLVWVQNSMSWP